MVLGGLVPLNETQTSQSRAAKALHSDTAVNVSGHPPVFFSREAASCRVPFAEVMETSLNTG